MDEMKALALDAIETMRGAALNDGATYLRRKQDGEHIIAECCSALQRFVASPGSINPNYDCMGETAASLIMLAATDPATFATMMAPISGGDGIDPNTVGGLIVLSNFLGAISDDHNYIIDPSGPLPVIRYEGQAPTWQPGISPRSMLDVLRPLLNRPAQGHTP